MNDQLMLAYEEAKQTRDAALDQVSENAESWMDAGIRELRAMIGEFPAEFQGETIRERITPVIGSPHTHHAWGALTLTAIRKGIIRPTGEYRITLSQKTHGHRTAVYTA